MIPNISSQMERSLTGWQGKIKGTNSAVSGTLVRSDVDSSTAGTPLAGATLATGTYYYYIPTGGDAAADCTLRTSGATGTGLSSAATFYKVLSDGITEKMNAAGTTAATTFAAFVNGTQQTVSQTAMRGEQGCLLKIVVPGASSVTFDQADFSGL